MGRQRNNNHQPPRHEENHSDSSLTCLGLGGASVPHRQHQVQLQVRGDDRLRGDRDRDRQQGHLPDRVQGGVQYEGDRGVQERHHRGGGVPEHREVRVCGQHHQQVRIEAVLKNVSYTETVCRSKLENICEKEFIDGEAKPVEGSCVSKPTEVCEEMTRFQEEFVDEDRCRDIPIKDCKNVQSEVCSQKQELDCEPQHAEDCQIVPHEECQHIVEKIPKKVSKKITKVVCDEEEDPTEIAEEESTNTTDDNTNNIINDIFEIFGIRNNGENEIEDEKPESVPVITTTEFMIDDGLISESTTKTTIISTTAPTTTTTTTSTTTSSTSTTTTTLRSSTVKDLENIPTEPVTTNVRRMDGSKIIFSDQELEARNKDLANRVYLNVIPTRPTSTETVPRTSEDPHSRIFFPE